MVDKETRKKGLTTQGERVLRIGDEETGKDELAWGHARKKPVTVRVVRVFVAFTVETLEGTMQGNPGDYLIEGVNGELYPCKPDIFEKTYDMVIQ